MAWSSFSTRLNAEECDDGWPSRHSETGPPTLSSRWDLDERFSGTARVGKTVINEPATRETALPCRVCGILHYGFFERVSGFRPRGAFSFFPGDLRQQRRSNKLRGTLGARGVSGSQVQRAGPGRRPGSCARFRYVALKPLDSPGRRVATAADVLHLKEVTSNSSPSPPLDRGAMHADEARKDTRYFSKRDEPFTIRDHVIARKLRSAGLISPLFFNSNTLRSPCDAVSDIASFGWLVCTRCDRVPRTSSTKSRCRNVRILHALALIAHCSLVLGACSGTPGHCATIGQPVLPRDSEQTIDLIGEGRPTSPDEQDPRRLLDGSRGKSS